MILPRKHNPLFSTLGAILLRISPKHCELVLFSGSKHRNATIPIRLALHRPFPTPTSRVLSSHLPLPVHLIPPVITSGKHGRHVPARAISGNFRRNQPRSRTTLSTLLAILHHVYSVPLFLEPYHQAPAHVCILQE